ncbi:hypothetical protein Tco_1489164, partial [Tanacetum coccineum]
ISDNSRKGVGFVNYNAIPPSPTGLFAPPTIDLSNSGLEEFQQPECLKAMDLRPVRVSIKIPLMRLTAITIKGKGWNITPRAVLMKTGLKPLNTAKEKVYTAKPKAVNTARPTSAVVNVVKANQDNVVKASACWATCPISHTSRMDGRTCNIEQKCVINQTYRQLKRVQDTKIPQFSGLPEKVGDEAVHKKLGDRMERAATTASSLEAEQDSGNINRTQSMATLNEQSP